ncbi:NrdH-redoxin [Candidatus Woesearchaeota archaeon]|jgi:glutaredoxin 3|nr:NrdH-redoxin [Candidatus Woesearchaeota archaeon]MBT5397300.1 NrdH-redoxin [Candidatus Woesearchaeota archaeon]MBT5924275.1 NrdH-redoxin [Candidatus Woesearchaeota archaeon]MBT6367855.1 NrdH-redoxin [Candidatus Woesearchaeota archaeon]MBT7762700.1 NrdH-redoxin [Candidatus Woesearchaeota archaeon]
MEVTIYTIPSCPWCKKLITWLKRKRIPFTECDTYEENSCRESLLNKTGQLAVPTVDIDGTVIIGFQEKQLSNAIEKAKKAKVPEVPVQDSSE